MNYEKDNQNNYDYYAHVRSGGRLPKRIGGYYE